MDIDVIYFQDSRFMREVENESVTLIVTSPPYWNVKDYSLDGQQQQPKYEKMPGQLGDLEDYQDYLDALDQVWRECERVLKPNGKLCINAPLMPIPKSTRNAGHTRYIVNIYSNIENEILAKTNLKLMDLYIWERANPTKRLMFGSYPYPPNFYAQNTSEFIGVFVKEGEPEKKPPETKEASKLTEEEWVEFTRQVWRIPIPHLLGDKEHPAVMPIEMAERLIRLYSFVGDIVLDPFMGSGTTARAALNLKRHYIGYEITPGYKETIEKRLAQPARLFQAPLKGGR